MTIVGLAATGTACDASGASNQTIAILPSASHHSSAWNWDATCSVGPHTANACAPAGPNLHTAQLTGDEWNLGDAPGQTGSLRMALDGSGRLQVGANFSTTPPCTRSTCIASQANTWVRGYPSVLYGIDQCHGPTAPPRSPLLRLPVRLGALPAHVVGDATYDAETAAVTDDVAYDIWLNPSNTLSPCRTNGTLEVMVWNRYDAEALLPDSMKVGTVTVPFAADGTANPGTQSWSVYASNIFQNGQTQPWGGVVWLVVDAAHSVDRGNFKVDLTQALDQVATLLQNQYSWKNVRARYWLDTIQFGVEFGPAHADVYGNEPTNFSFDLTSYCLHVGTAVSATGKC